MRAGFFPRWVILTMLVFVSVALAQPKAALTDKNGISPALLARAKAGDAEAQYQLGNAYNYGDKVRQDYAQALMWYRKASEQGNADSQFQLGGLYHFGHGVPQDEGQAFVWIVKAAQQGHIDAEFFISTCYTQGWVYHGITQREPFGSERPLNREMLVHSFTSVISMIQARVCLGTIQKHISGLTSLREQVRDRKKLPRGEIWSLHS